MKTIILLILLPIFAFSFDASFECKKASTSIEKYICSDKELAKDDKELGILYGYLKTYSPKKQKKTFVKKQRAWLKNRIKVCDISKEFVKDNNVLKCLKDEYQNRMEELRSIDDMSLELGPWYYTKIDSSDPFAGYYSVFYEVHSATTLEDSSIVENFLSIIKIKDPKMKNKYRVSGDFICANYHMCSIRNDDAMLSYIIMELKDGKLVFSQKAFDDKVCELSIGKTKDTLVIGDKYNTCTQYNFSCGARCGLNGWEFKLKTTDEFAQNNIEEEFYPLKKDAKYGLANEKGEWILEAQFDDVMVINEVGGSADTNGWIKVKINNKWGVINKEGAWVLKPKFDEMSYFELLNLVAAKYNGKYGLVNKKGEWILKPQFDEIRRYAENDATGFGVVTLNGKWGLIDDRGNWVLKQKFDHIEILNDRIHVKFGDQEGYTTLDGKYLTFTKDELRNERYKDENSRIYPFVCYAKKIKDNADKTIYQECARSEAQCSTIEKLHFGEYLNDFTAYEAFNRCSKGDPKFVDLQEGNI